VRELNEKLDLKSPGATLSGIALLRSIAIGLACLAVAALVTRLFNQALVRHLTPSNRAVTLRARMPSVARAAGRNLVIFGCSVVEEGFSPKVFDEAMAQAGYPLSSWNLGMTAANFEQQLAMGRKYAEHVSRGGTAPDTVLLEFAPKLGDAKASLEHTNDVRVAQFLTWAGLREEFRVAPQSAIRRAGLWVVDAPERGTVLKGLRERFFAPEDPDWFVPYLDDANVAAGFRTLRQELRATGEEKRSSVASEWTVERRGEKAWPSPEDRALQRRWEQLVLSPSSSAFQRSLVEGEGASELDLDPRALRDFTQLIREMKHLTPRVVVVVFPRNHAFPNSIRFTDESVARLNKVLESFKLEGAQVLDLQWGPPEITERPELFADLEHFNLEGRIAVSRLIAEKLAPLLQNTGSSTGR